jgi:MFS transporter, DHA2 family, multidrug resistance protein
VRPSNKIIKGRREPQKWIAKISSIIAALAAGMALTPRGIGAFAATIIVGRIAGHISNRVLMVASSLLLGYACFALGNINLQVAPSNLLWPIIISGVAAASIFVPLTTSAMGTLGREQMGNAAGIFNLMRNIGGSIGIAAITTLVTRHAQAEPSYACVAYVEV